MMRKKRNLNCERDFEVSEAICNLSTSRVFAGFGSADPPAFSYCFLRINVNRVQYIPLLYVMHFPSHLCPNLSDQIKSKTTNHKSQSDEPSTLETQEIQTY